MVYVYGILAYIHSDKGQSFENAITSKFTPCITSSSLRPCLTIHAEIPSLRDLIIHCKVSCNFYQKNKRAVGPCMFHHWCLLIIPCLTALLDISLMNSCLGIKHLPFVMLGWGWPNIMIRPQPTSMHG